MNIHAFEVAADGPEIYASVFAPTGKDARRIFWELIGDDARNSTASLEVIWDYADGRHPFTK